MDKHADLYTEMLQLLSDAVGFCLYGNQQKLIANVSIFFVRLSLLHLKNTKMNPKSNKTRAIIALFNAFDGEDPKKLTTIQLSGAREVLEYLSKHDIFSTEELNRLTQILGDSGFSLDPGFFLNPEGPHNEQKALEDAYDDS